MKDNNFETILQHSLNNKSLDFLGKTVSNELYKNQETIAPNSVFNKITSNQKTKPTSVDNDKNNTSTNKSKYK